jgi:hypothetical protein
MYMALVTRHNAATIQNTDSCVVTHKNIVESKESKTTKFHIDFISLAAVYTYVIK